MLYQLAQAEALGGPQHEGLLGGAPVKGKHRGWRDGLGCRLNDPIDRGSKEMPYCENLLYPSITSLF